MALFRAAFAHFGTPFGTSNRVVHHEDRLAMRFGALRAGINGRPPVARLFRA
jgi:hypothetical protein